MVYSLNSHVQQYDLSLWDCGLSAITLLSGTSYALRHWELAEQSPEFEVKRQHPGLRKL